MSVVRKSAQTLIASLLVFAQGLLLTPIVIKVSGPSVFGGYVLVVSYLGIMYGVSSLGVGVHAKRWLPSTDDPSSRAALFFPQFTFQLVVVLALAAFSMLAYLVGTGTGRLHLAGFSVWLIPSYLLSYVLYSQTTDFYRNTHRVGTFNVAIVAQPYLFIAISLLIFLFAGVLNTGTLILSVTMASLLVAIPQLWRVRTEIGLGFRFPQSTTLIPEVKLGVPLVLAYLLDVILAGGDRYIIAVVMSVRDVGTYAPAYALGSLVVVVPKAFGVVLPPLLSQRVDADDAAGARRMMLGASRAFLLVSVPFVVGSLVLGEQVLRLYANEEVSKAAWPIVPLVALASVFYGLILIDSILLFVRLQTRALLWVNSIAALVNVVLNVALLVTTGSIVAAAVATLLSYALSYVLLARRVSRDTLHQPIDTGWLFRVVVSALLMGAALVVFMKAIPVDRPAYTLLCVVFAVGVYAGVSLVTGTADELHPLFCKVVSRILGRG